MPSTRLSLNDLEDGRTFAARHIGPDAAEIQEMLKVVGVSSLETLVDSAVPASIRTDRPLSLAPPLSERDALRRLRAFAARNTVKTSLIGMGYADTATPSVILRNVIENPGWYTAYTPYQAEVSQGRLEVLLAFQQMVCDLTGMELANASLLDEATAAAEAMAMSRRVSKAAGNVFVVDRDCHPQTLAVVRTRARSLGYEVVEGNADELLRTTDCFGVLLQYPGSSGAVRDLRPLCREAAGKGAIVTVATDLLSLVLLTPPGEQGADVVIGNAQRFGVPMGFGGPHAAFFATRDTFKRSTPGRIIGVSVDAQGRQAYRMALQTREQHIRREKATSNICTAQVLLAMVAALYAIYHGPDGLLRIARRVNRLTWILAEGLRRLGVEIVHADFFDTLTLRVPGRADAIADRAESAGINLRRIDDDTLGAALDEVTDRDTVGRLLSVFAEVCGGSATDIETLDAAAPDAAVPDALARSSDFLGHPVFHRYRSETEMMRYLRRLAAKDIALDRAMIPLGSCTMKLNAATEMIPVTWPEFGGLHPFVPAGQAAGYHALIDELSAMLCEITGFDAISFQPNAGSQGEYSGLLTIRRYHEERGEGGRDVCLIPASAHGTNPASAVLAGLRVVVVKCDDQGNVDVGDLKAKTEEHGPRLAALMVTYPSTHGVYEAAIREICDIVHAAGGQVYMDGANMNALVGICRPAEIGADVCHLNLHKTFCIPHGGGGPGMGPIGVRAHLTPFLPDHTVVANVNPDAHPAGTTGPVSAAPWGSPSILPISWAYIAMCGAEGLLRATQVAILGANYVAKRLSGHFPILYTGQNGMVAHECIIDLGPITDRCGITVEDVAKRLADYGFHAPTMSFPVPDTLMIEPTESESLEELDRFCDAMIAIRAEIADVESGAADANDNLLRNAPHSLHVGASDRWDRPYGREQALFPMPGLREDKYWPPVGRIDNVHGDRHLVCICPPMEAYDTAAE